MYSKRFSVKGMRCAGCAGNIEKLLRTQPGVKKATVNFATSTLEIEWSASCSDNEYRKAAEAVQKLGFVLIPYQRDLSGNELTIRAGKEFRAFLAAAFFTIILLLLHWQIIPVDAVAVHIFMPVLILPVLAAGRNFFQKGIPALFRGTPDMDTLIALGAGAAAAVSFIKTAMGIRTGLYYDMTGMIITMILLGRTLEARARQKTFAAIQTLAALAPPRARIVENGREREIDLAQLRPGNICAVLAGESFPADCTVTEGNSCADESMLTGESMPVPKNPGSKVTAGTINQSGRLLCKVEAAGENTVLAGIIRIVENAQADKPPVARIADAVAGFFVPAVLAAGAVVFAVWFFISGFDFALQRALAVLVTACPCALGLATPAALIVGIGTAARKGVLFKSGTALETASKINRAVFDKTGTLTTGKPAVTGIVAVNVSRRDFLALASGLEAVSTHPLAAAIREAAAREGVEPEPVSEAVVEAGGGVCGKWQGKLAAIGSWDFLVTRGLGKNTRRPASPGSSTLIFMAVDGLFAGMLLVDDPMRSSVPETIKKLEAMGISTSMLSGDNPASVANIAAKSGISDFHSALLPGAKEKILQSYRSQGYITAMIGDGINDAPALAAADMGIALASGTDVAIAACDAVLPSNDPAVLPEMFSLARQMMRVIKQNLFWAFFYNIISIPVAAGVLVPLGVAGIPPALCAAAMAVSSITVVCNSLRLRHCK